MSNLVSESTITTTLPAISSPEHILMQTLLSDKTFDIEFNGYLSNHAKHAIIALARLGASESQILNYWNNYTTLTPYNLRLDTIDLKQRQGRSPCSKDEWFGLRGKKKNFIGMVKFLEQELQTRFDNCVAQLVAEYVPDLIPGLACALTHAIIHTGWALDTHYSGGGDPYMVLEGLAYMNFAFLSVHPERFLHDATMDSTPIDSLIRVAQVWKTDDLAETWIAKTKAMYNNDDTNFHPELIPAGFQWDLAKILEHPHEVAVALPRWLDVMDLSALLEEMYKAATMVYLATLDPKDKHGNFLVLHLITSLWGLEHVLKAVHKDSVSRRAFKCFYAAMISLLCASSGGFPTIEALETVKMSYCDASLKNGDDDNESEVWSNIVERGIHEVEEHNIKLVYVCRELWRRYDRWIAFRHAAEAFTVTPNIGPSSLSFKA